MSQRSSGRSLTFQIGQTPSPPRSERALPEDAHAHPSLRADESMARNAGNVRATEPHAPPRTGDRMGRSEPGKVRSPCLVVLPGSGGRTGNTNYDASLRMTRSRRDKYWYLRLQEADMLERGHRNFDSASEPSCKRAQGGNGGEKRRKTPDPTLLHRRQRAE